MQSLTLLWQTSIHKPLHQLYNKTFLILFQEPKEQEVEFFIRGKSEISLDLKLWQQNQIRKPDFPGCELSTNKQGLQSAIQKAIENLYKNLKKLFAKNFCSHYSKIALTNVL